MQRRELLLGLAGGGLTSGSAPASHSAPSRDPETNQFVSYTNVPLEFSFTGTNSYTDIFNQIEVDVVFRGPDGGQWKVPAFWAGDRNFRVRFAAPVAGHYTYRSVCTNPRDQGLHSRTGEFDAVPYDGTMELYRHGRLRAAASKRTLEHADGTPFFWMGDTWWFGLVKRLDWPAGFRRLVADRVGKGFSLIQIVAGPLPDYDAAVNPFDPQQANEAGLSWEHGWLRINPAFYDLADLRIAYLVESGLLPCVVGMWGYFLPAMGIENVKKHWRNLVARYSAWPVVWCMAGEVNMPTYSLASDKPRRDATRIAQEEGWTEVTRYVRGIDPFHNPITAHPSFPDSRAMLRDDSLLDVDMLQTGHSGYLSLKRSVETLHGCVARRPRMPVVNGEVSYEGIMGGSKDEIQRFLFWASITEGACGHTYGAQGIWAMNSPHQEHRGFTGNWGDGYWQDVMHYPGSRQVGIGRRFFERYPWWWCEPMEASDAKAWGAISPYATRIPKALLIAYLPANSVEEQLKGLLAKGGNRIGIEPGASYQAYYFNPRTGEDVRTYTVFGLKKIELGAVVPDSSGRWNLPPKPTMEDWVLVLEDKSELARFRAQKT